MYRYEFGGPIGVLAMMLGFPVLMCELRARFVARLELTDAFCFADRLPLDLPLVLPGKLCLPYLSR